MTEPGQPPRPSRDELPWVLEALLLASEEPLGPAALARATGVGERSVRSGLERLADDYEARGLRVQEEAGRYQLVTSPDYAPYVRPPPRRRVNGAALAGGVGDAHHHCLPAALHPRRGRGHPRGQLRPHRRLPRTAGAHRERGHGPFARTPPALPPRSPLLRALRPPRPLRPPAPPRRRSSRNRRPVTSHRSC